METKYLGANVIVTLEDKRYHDTKDFDTDGDDATESIRLNADELLVVKTHIAEVFGITQTQAENVIMVMKNSPVGIVDIVLKPSQFAALMLYAQDHDYIVVLTFKPEVIATHIDLSGETYLR